MGQAKIEPLIVFTDSPPALAVRELISLPVALVMKPDDNGDNLSTFCVGRNTLAVAKRAEDDRPLITERLAELADWFDLAEPFERIRQAIERSPTGSAMSVFHWYAPPPPEVTSVRLESPVRPAATDWNQALSESITPAVHTVGLDAQETLRTISIPICTAEVRMRSFIFPSPFEEAIGNDSDPKIGTVARQRRPGPP